jgi:hypothetical protein
VSSSLRTAATAALSPLHICRELFSQLFFLVASSTSKDNVLRYNEHVVAWVSGGAGVSVLRKPVPYKETRLVAIEEI